MAIAHTYSKSKWPLQTLTVNAERFVEIGTAIAVDSNQSRIKHIHIVWTASDLHPSILDVHLVSTCQRTVSYKGVKTSANSCVDLTINSMWQLAQQTINSCVDLTINSMGQ